MTEVKQTEPPLHVLGLHPIDVKIATAIDCRADFRGYSMAAKTILQTVKSARAHFPEHVTAEWLELTEAHTARIKTIAECDTLLGTVDDGVARERIYGQFARPTKANVTTTALAQLNAAIGLIVLAAVVQSRTVPASVVSAWVRLKKCGSHREGRHPDWERLAKHFPTSRAEVGHWLETSTETEMVIFLKTLEVAMDTPLLSPHTIQTRTSSPPESDTSSEAKNQEDAAKPDTETLPRTVPAPPESYSGWLIQRANQSGFLSHLGLQNQWEMQTPGELKDVCHRIYEALGGTPEEQKFALFAILSLNSGLPANLLIKVGLKPNTDLWVDFTSGCIHWCLLRFLNLELAKSVAVEDVPRHLIMDIWLPIRTQEVSDALASIHSDATNVVEFLMGKRDELTMLTFLSEYRAWLTSLGGHSLHHIYDARFARSLGQIYRQQFNDLVAAFNSLDFSECSMGMLHYVRFSRQFLYQATVEAFESLGLGKPVTSKYLTEAVGSISAMEFPDFLNGLNGLWNHREAATSKMLAAQTVKDAIDQFNEITHVDQLLEVSLSAGRDERFGRLTWGNLQVHPNLIIQADKDIDQYTKFRIIPAHRVLKQVLNAHAEVKSLFCKTLDQLGVKPHSPRGSRFNANSPHLTYFVKAEAVDRDGKTCITRKATDSSQLQALSVTYLNGSVNAGRHTIISAFACTKTDPWLHKILTGHYRGQCEPFSDGQSIAPATAIRQLCLVLDDLFAPLSLKIESNAGDVTLPLSTLQGRLPSGVNESIQSDKSRARVLGSPFDGYTLLSLRVIDRLLTLLRNGNGPEHAGANLLLNLLVENWITLSDVKVIWTAETPFIETSPGCAHLMWIRPECRTEIRVVLTVASLIAVGNFKKRGIDRSWMGANTEAQEWLVRIAPGVSWPESGDDAVARLSALMARWLRFNLPPFLLTAASPKMTSPTASPRSFMRLIDGAILFKKPENLLQYPKPKPRGKGNLKFHKTKLKEIIDLVHEHANAQKSEGEDWQLMKDLKEAASKVDCSFDFAAATVRDWIENEAELWKNSRGGRIEVSSLSTYLYLLSPAFSQLFPIHNLKEWTHEWFEFTAALSPAEESEGDKDYERKVAQRITAAKRFTSQLKSLGYPIPTDLFEGRISPHTDGMRKSAASVLLLQKDRSVIRELMVQHFGDWPLDARLAGLYVDLRFNLSLRSIEAAVLPLDAIDQFGHIAITTDGFSHLKSSNARRLQELLDEVITEFKSLGQSILAARPESSWVFLLDDRHDWRLVVSLERAFSASLKQVTKDPDAVPHSTRSVSPLNELFPDWEKLAQGMLNGKAKCDDYQSFLSTVEKFGFTNIARISPKMGHGHPLTYLKYYFALWDILLSVHLRAQEMRFDCSHALVRNRRIQYKAAFEKARQRHGPGFNGIQWLIKKELETLELPSFKCAAVAIFPPPAKLTTTPNKKIPLHDKVRYLAARFAKLESDAAAFEFGIDSATISELEGKFCIAETGQLLVRHQSKPSERGKKAEIIFLKSAGGALLTRQLLHSDTHVLEEFGEALAPKRTYRALTPTLSAVQQSIKAFLSCLPPTLSILVQVAPGRYQSDELAQLADISTRVQVGRTDPDLGARPRFSVVDFSDPNNLVLRARRTSSTRCLVSAILLLSYK
jgi:hypothetical protein